MGKVRIEREIECDHCDGTGTVIEVKYVQEEDHRFKCSKCKAHGLKRVGKGIDYWQCQSCGYEKIIHDIQEYEAQIK